MGLFDQAQGAMGGDWAAQAQAAQALAAQHLQAGGYTDGSQVTMANAGQVGAQMAADRDELTAYGNELNRIIAVGTPGTGVITSSVDTGERTGGNPWFQLEIDVTIEGYAPFTVSKREMVPPQFLAQYAAGTTHPVKVDPANPQALAFTG